MMQVGGDNDYSWYELHVVLFVLTHFLFSSRVCKYTDSHGSAIF